jgi:putative transposase
VPDFPFRKHVRLPSEAYADQESLFHVTVRAVPGSSPFRGEIGAAVWSAILGERDRQAVALIAACLMPDHLHLLVKPRTRSISQWMAAFKSYTTTVTRQAGGRSFLWQPGFYDRHIRSHSEYEATVAYIVTNPAAAGIVTDDAEWPWVYVRDE